MTELVQEAEHVFENVWENAAKAPNPFAGRPGHAPLASSTPAPATPPAPVAPVAPADAPVAPASGEKPLTLMEKLKAAMERGEANVEAELEKIVGKE